MSCYSVERPVRVRPGRLLRPLAALLAMAAACVLLSGCAGPAATGDRPTLAPGSALNESPPPGASSDPVRQRFITRPSYDTCGKVVLGHGRLARTSTEWTCMTAAVAAGKGAELAVSAPTVEGDPIIYYLRVNPDGTSELYVDNSADRYAGSGSGWQHSTCQDALEGCWGYPFGSPGTPTT